MRKEPAPSTGRLLHLIPLRIISIFVKHNFEILCRGCSDNPLLLHSVFYNYYLWNSMDIKFFFEFGVLIKINSADLYLSGILFRKGFNYWRKLAVRNTP
ncbi:MAG: hypothetical protein QOC96_2610 [Acidobacteriota bacterium]|nr:hypothetical protein [Acidobacteriota bacterium]